MSDMPKGPALKFLPNQREITRKLYNLDNPRRLKEALDLMRDWIQKQAHFRKKDFSDEYLERLLLNNKGSIEKSKVCLDKLCTLKTLWADFFATIDVPSREKYFKYYSVLIIPEPTDDMMRLVIFKIFPTSPLYPDTLAELLRYSVIAGEYLKIKEYCDGFVMIQDYRHCKTMDLLAITNLNQLLRAKTLYVEAYGLRVKYLHILTTSSVSDAFVMMVKQVMSKKLRERFYVHTSLDSLYKFVPKKLLPTEYGGEVGPMEEIRTNFYRELCTKEHIEYLKEMIAASTDESKRAKDTYNETYVNMPGAFRSLILD